MTALLARWTEKLAGGPQAGTRVMGVGRQQQQKKITMDVIKGYVVMNDVVENEISRRIMDRKTIK